MLVSARRTIALAVSLALAVPSVAFVAPRDAHAQPKRPKSVGAMLSGEAKKQWDSGVNLEEARQYDAARSAFLQAYELSKNPRVLFNVAVMEIKSGRYAAAADTFKRELDEGKGVLSREEESDITNAVAGLQKYIMTLTVDVSEPDAKIFVDDIEQKTPLKGPISVAVGSHRVRASKPGFADAQVYIDGSERSPRVTLKLEPFTKSTRVSISIVGPKSAVVKIDGKEVGTATPATPYAGQVNVQTEPHQFTVEANGFVTVTQPAVARDGEALNLSLQMSEEQAKGKLIVVSNQEGASIEIDGQPRGATRWEGPVDVGNHQIQVKKRGFYTWIYDVQVPRGGERSVTATLNEDRNTSFVPWLIGTVLVVGAGTVFTVFILKEKDQDPVNGTLAPFTVNTLRFR